MQAQPPPTDAATAGDGPVAPGFRLSGRAGAAALEASVGDAVYDEILAALQAGRLQPGERLHDGQLAAQLGVSRTPVREALLRLRQLGVVEFAAGRFTRVAVIDHDLTAHAAAAWVTSYAPIAAEAATVGLDPRLLAAMWAAHERYGAAKDPFDVHEIFASNADFYDQPTLACSNPLLVRSADNVVHMLRLGLLQLPRPLNPEPLHEAQRDLLDALVGRDVSAARRAVYSVAAIPL